VKVTNPLLYRDVVSRYLRCQVARKNIPITLLPRVACDFNSAGWSGEDDDPCYYSFDEQALARARPRSGLRVFIFEASRENLIMGCEAEVEPYPHPATGEPRWRLRPVENTGYLGEP
jgi:hypothetical protein